jgi:acyl-CoA thioesterase FadM
VLEQGLYSGETCFAAARSVMVVMDHASRRPIPIPEALRAGLTRLEPIA